MPTYQKQLASFDRTMAPAAAPLHVQVQLAVVICILLWSTALVDADERRPATITERNDDGSQIWGYVEVRNKAHMFWFYQKSPHRVSSADKPWPTLLYAAPACSKYIRIEGVNMEDYPRTGNDVPKWLHHADIIFVDSPVGTGFSYYDQDASPDVKNNVSFSQMGADVVELLKDLAVQIPTLPSSPLILLSETYAGHHVGHVSGIVLRAIHGGRLHLKVGGLVFWFHGKSQATIMPLSLSAEDNFMEHELSTGVALNTAEQAMH